MFDIRCNTNVNLKNLNAITHIRKRTGLKRLQFAGQGDSIALTKTRKSLDLHLELGPVATSTSGRGVQQMERLGVVY